MTQSSVVVKAWLTGKAGGRLLKFQAHKKTRFFLFYFKFTLSSKGVATSLMNYLENFF